MLDGKKVVEKVTLFVGVRIIPEARNKLFDVAREERRSVSKQIEHMIMNYTIRQ